MELKKKKHEEKKFKGNLLSLSHNVGSVRKKFQKIEGGSKR